MDIGLMGVGLMGLPMAERLIEQGISLTVYNRTTYKLEPLRALEVTVAATPQELISRCDCIILMVTDRQAIAELLFASEEGLTQRTIIQMGTIAPQESLELQHQVESLGGTYLEAPVLGSIPEAKAGSLLVMVGATAEQFQQWQPLLQKLGRHPLHLGVVGKASAAKLALNHLIAGLTTTFGLSLKLIQHYEVDVEAFMQILRASALYAPTFDKKLDRMVQHHYQNPNFPTKHLLKDINLFATEAEQAGLETISVQSLQTILQQAIALGLADQDYAALVEALLPSGDR